MSTAENILIRVKNADEAFMYWYKMLSDMSIDQESRM